MNKFLSVVAYAMIANMIVVEGVNIVLDLEMSVIYVIAWVFVSSVLGVSLATAIRYAIKLAKEHEA